MLQWDNFHAMTMVMEKLLCVSFGRSTYLSFYICHASNLRSHHAIMIDNETLMNSFIGN